MSGDISGVVGLIVSCFAAYWALAAVRASREIHAQQKQDAQILSDLHISVLQAQSRPNLAASLRKVAEGGTRAIYLENRGLAAVTKVVMRALEEEVRTDTLPPHQTLVIFRNPPGSSVAVSVTFVDAEGVKNAIELTANFSGL